MWRKFSLHWSITLGFYASSRGRLCKKHPRPTNILSQIYSRLIGPLMKMAQLAQIRKKGKFTTNQTIFKIEPHGTPHFVKFWTSWSVVIGPQQKKVESTVCCFQTFPVRYCTKTCKWIFAIMRRVRYQTTSVMQVRSVARALS